MKHNSENIGCALSEWFTTPAGKALLELEINTCQSLLMNVFGFHALQIGYLEHPNYLEKSTIVHRIGMQYPLPLQPSISPLCAHYDSLPFASDSLDLICLPHVLETLDEPNILLEEVARVLIPQGYLLITGFHSNVLWKSARYLCPDVSPYDIKILAFKKLLYDLDLWDCDVVDIKMNKISLPLDSSDGWKKKYWKWLSKRSDAIYILLVKKRPPMVTPMQWRTCDATLIKDTVTQTASWRSMND